MEEKHSFLYNGTVFNRFPGSIAGKNRAFRLGDGFFETIRVKDGAIPYWSAHYSRIQLACKALNLDIPYACGKELFVKTLHDFIYQGGVRKGGVLRITFFREGEGTYRPESNKLGYVAELRDTANNNFMLNDSGLRIGIYTDLKKSPGKFAPFKMMGMQVYIQASIWAQNNDYQDALILNDHNQIIEGTSSNLFVVIDGTIHTPPIKHGCVAGIMRMVIINTALKLGIPVYESSLDEKDLLKANEVFLTNATNGVRWVSGYREKRYFHNTSDKILAKLNEQAKVLS